LKAKGGNTNAAYNDKYLVGDGSTPSNAVAAAFFLYIPSTQFYVKDMKMALILSKVVKLLL